jgi:ribosomal protein S12 methylthiotransferase accessory factor
MLDVSVVSDPRVEYAALNRLVSAGTGGDQIVVLLPLQQLQMAEDSARLDCGVADTLLALCGGGEIWVIDVADQAGCLICFRNWLLAGDAELADLLARDGDIAIGSLDVGLLAGAAITLVQVRQAAAKDGIWQAVRLDAEHGQVALHCYARHPDCVNCRADQGDQTPAIPVPLAAMTAALGQRTASLAELANGLRRVVLDPRLGLVRHAFRPDASLLQSVSIAPLYPFTTPSFTESGYGRSGDPIRDGDIAVFEAIERFAAMKPRGAAQVVRDSRTNLGDVALDPATLISHVDAAFAPGRMVRYSPSTVYDWVWAYSHRQQRQILIPQQLAYYGQFGEEPCGGRFVQETSSGSAIGGSVEEAMLYGLIEAVERDAFLVSWYGHRRCPTILPSSVAGGVLDPLLARLAAQGLELVIQTVAIDLPVHVFAVRVLNRSALQDRACYIAAGAHLDPLDALNSAINEVISMVRNYPEDHARQQAERGRYLLDRPDEVRTMADHECLCWPGAAIDRFGLASDDLPVSWDAYLASTQGRWDSPTNLASLIAAITRLGGDVLFADLGYRELRFAGVHCVKAICTGLLPITFGHHNRRIDWARVAQHSDIALERLQSPELLRPHTFP